MALSADRNTPHMDGEQISVPVAASAKCYAGGIAVANASGYAVPGSTATTLTYLGRFEETVDNTSGENGDKAVLVRRRKAFKWKNSGADTVTQASLGKACYIVDDETVAATNGTNTRSAAGIVVGIDSDGVWVQ
ncbi:hypothetical protein [Desulfocurvibacter africanus]|uniref:Bacteriophage protein n=1 Tax=Desulfocurvibacter africanus subsp. africanus str. Walvis Bay TaxID=690850 RepID=F3YW12_DESAF|nr:hypothetical protein [Desulfocurvibacter africanus]EGJ49042.1 hypothetical protein Desaf_0690 [Desulfocurvibacter africanus subsp. africanus str. Walvis Bay]